MNNPAQSPMLNVIPEDKLGTWLDALAKQGSLIAPSEEAGNTIYRRVGSYAEITLGNSRPILPVKEVFFPPTERLLTIKIKGAEVQVKENLPEGETIVFGVRPCEARGARFLEALFVDTLPADAYFAKRRENTTLIGIACKEMGGTCFCTSVGGAPDDPTGMDLMLTPVEGGYLAEAISQKGHAFLARAGWPETVVGGRTQPEGEIFPVPGRETWIRNFNNEQWAKLSEACLSCRVCAYVCPTCRCFAVRDEALGLGEFERIRCWDSCAGENYRRVAGGHRPRAEKGERLRNRFACKFVYFPEQAGLGNIIACTGCGRCIEACPAGVDITEVILSMRKLA